MAKISAPKVTGGLKKAMEASGVRLKENLTSEKVEQAIIEYLDENNVLHLATVSKDSEPRATPIEYRNKGLTIYLFSEGGIKIINIKNNPKVSVSIASPYNRHKDYFGSRGLQIWGKAHVYTKKENPDVFRECLSVMQINENMLPSDFLFKVIKIEPDRGKYMDARKGYWSVSWIK